MRQAGFGLAGQAEHNCLRIHVVLAYNAGHDRLNGYRHHSNTREVPSTPRGHRSHEAPQATNVNTVEPIIRPLAAIAGDITGGAAITSETLADLQRTAAYARLRTYFEDLPRLSFMTPDSRATLYALIRLLRPKVVAEVGTLFAGTAEVMTRALWENGEGVLHTTDPFGADRCPEIIAGWPRELRDITHFHPLNSMDFFLELDRRRIVLDLALVDGNHDYEFALFDLQMAARLLRPGGIIVMDNAEQTGPFHASRTFVAHHPAWRELGATLASYNPFRPFDVDRASLPGTSFVVLQAPDHLSISADPHSWGQLRTELPAVAGFALELPAQVTSGTLIYQAILRMFGEALGDVRELKSIGSLRVDLTGSPAKLTPTLSVPLDTGQPPGGAGAHFTFEIDLSWQADRGAAALALSAVPVPFALGKSGA
jgi:predicted O-methyltransferase YrrM